MQPVRAWNSTEVYALHMPLYSVHWSELQLACFGRGERGCGGISLPFPRPGLAPTGHALVMHGFVDVFGPHGTPDKA